MKMYYASHLETGWDFAVHANSIVQARELIAGQVEKYAQRCDWEALKEWAANANDIAQYHFAACVPIFTECDPIQSRLGRQEIDELHKDKARLDWLEANLLNNPLYPVARLMYSSEGDLVDLDAGMTDRTGRIDNDGTWRVCGVSVRAAIDVAMEAKP